MKIFIDKGHGSDTAGKRRPDGRFLEYKFNRSIAPASRPQADKRRLLGLPGQPVSIEFRPVDIPTWLDASRERLLRAPRPLRLRLRCQREKWCRSKVRHKCRPYHRPGSLASGRQDCGRCPLRVQVPHTCFRLPHCLGRFAPCGYSLPPALRRADYRLAPVIVLPL